MLIYKSDAQIDMCRIPENLYWFCSIFCATLCRLLPKSLPGSNNSPQFCSIESMLEGMDVEACRYKIKQMRTFTSPLEKT